MALTKKQKEFLKAFSESVFQGKNIFILAGGAGSGKSFICLLLLHKLALEYPNSRFGVFRKSLSTLKKTTIPSFFKVLEETNTFNSVKIADLRVEYENRSQIIFNWADLSKDPDCNNIKGLELSGALFEEVNQIEKPFFYTALSRAGRWDNGFPPFIIANCNPNVSWVKSEFYDPYVSGKLPHNIYLQESLPSDNSNLSAEYLQTLKSLPEQEKQRFYHNRWDYDDNPARLIPAEAFSSCVFTEISPAVDEPIFLGVDPADEGKDSTVLCFMQGNCVIRWEEFKKFNEIKTAHLVKLRAQELSIDPKNIIIDSVGIGAGCLNTLREAGFHVNKFVGGESAKGSLDFYTFKNLRAEAAWMLRESFMRSEIRLAPQVRLQNEVASITYTIDDDKSLRLQAKKEIKKALSHSPDFFDALMMANYLRIINSSGFKKVITSKINRLSPIVINY